MTPHAPARTLGELAAAAGAVVTSLEGEAETPIAAITNDSRAAAPGSLFVAVPGWRADGHEYARAAVAAGAAAVCVERPLGIGVPEIRVTDARIAAARMAAAFHGMPARALRIVGVTGTNGKTTTAYLLAAIVKAAGERAGLIGTIETRIGDDVRPGVRTTPDAIDLQAVFAEMRDAGVTSVAMEVTSHALALHRVEGVRFASAAFTNLSQDHLDFHPTMEDYFEAKRSLFTPDRTRRGAVNIDDPYGRRLYEDAAVPLIGFGMSEDAAVRALDARSGPWGQEFLVRLSYEHRPCDELKLKTSLVGSFNLSNCLAAAAAALLAGIDPAAVEAGIAALGSVPGRFEAIDEGQPFTCVVDYAHTPDSLDNVLREARKISQHDGGRVIAVFGCGGDRDRGKRPLMGSVAARRADVVIVTSDNPRSEEPVAIIDEILEGVIADRPTGPDAVVVDRRDAIAEAIEMALPGDVVVIAGKGHETGQQFGETVVPFDDREVARAILGGLGWLREGSG